EKNRNLPERHAFLLRGLRGLLILDRKHGHHFFSVRDIEVDIGFHGGVWFRGLPKIHHGPQLAWTIGLAGPWGGDVRGSAVDKPKQTVSNTPLAVHPV